MCVLEQSMTSCVDINLVTFVLGISTALKAFSGLRSQGNDVWCMVCGRSACYRRLYRPLVLSILYD